MFPFWLSEYENGHPFIPLLARLFQTSLSVKPNAVFFFIDDMGWTDLGYMGSKYYESPHVDKLAKDGMVFMNAYASAPNCAPSRACLMSGQYSPQTWCLYRGEFRSRFGEASKTDSDQEHDSFGGKVRHDGRGSSGGRITRPLPWGNGTWDDPTTQGFGANSPANPWGSPSGGGYHSPYKYPNLEQEEKGST